MMGESSRSKREGLVAGESVSDGEGDALRFAVRIAGGGLAEGGLIAQHAVADARHLVGQGADGLVVIGAALPSSTPTLASP